jgi:Family of unknown function (DUF6230)
MSLDHTDTLPNEPRRGRTRWLRFGATMLVTGAMAATLIGLTAAGVLAASFSISGIPFTVTSTELRGTGFEQFAALDTMPEGSPNAGDTGGQIIVIVSAIQSAQLDNLCQSISLGGAFLKITAGDAGTPVTATTLVVDSDQINGGSATFEDIDIGQDASTLTRVPGVTGNIGIFGQQARTVRIVDLRQNNFATTAALFTLPHLSISFTDTGC